MEMYLIYFFKASIGIILFYLLYQFVLRKETFYTSNRIFLIIGLVLAVLLPIFPITYISPVSMLNNSEFFTFDSQALPIILSSNSDINNEESFWQIATIISSLYIIGASFFFLRLLLQTAFLLFKFSVGEKLQIDGVITINLKKSTAPFSFFKVVFINIESYSKEELSNIIAHEKVHIRERHWVDLLIVELLTVVFWINPIVWLYEKSIKQNHEYLADQGVLLAGYNTGQYQALLINQLMGVKVMGFTNNLNFSLNKKRMEMMKKEKSPNSKKVKLFISLPIVALLIFAFAQPEYVMIEDNRPTSKELAFNETEMISVKGTIKAEDGTPLAGTNIVIKGTQDGTVADEKGKYALDMPNGGTLVASYIGYESVPVTVNTSGKAKKVVNVEMKKGVFDIQIPKDIKKAENIVMGYWAEPSLDSQAEEAIIIIEKMPMYKSGWMHKLAQDILIESETVMKNTIDRGTATIGFVVLADGNVGDVHVVESSGSNVLDNSAVKIIIKLNNWEPGIQNGKKVPASVSVPVSFN